jgi:hypothetical protein
MGRAGRGARAGRRDSGSAPLTGFLVKAGQCDPLFGLEESR